MSLFACLLSTETPLVARRDGGMQRRPGFHLQPRRAALKGGPPVSYRNQPVPSGSCGREPLLVRATAARPLDHRRTVHLRSAVNVEALTAVSRYEVPVATVRGNELPL